jgi:hypothetical protein
MEGKSAHGAAGIPKSSNFFNKMMRIPDNLLVNWLQDVIDGTSDLAKFKLVCNHYKLMEKLWDSVASDLREFIAPPADRRDLLNDMEGLHEWQEDLDQDDARKKINEQFPGVVKILEDRATSWSKGNLKDVVCDQMMARCKAHMQAQVKAREEAEEPEPELSQPVRDYTRIVS